MFFKVPIFVTFVSCNRPSHDNQMLLFKTALVDENISNDKKPGKNSL